MIEMNRSIPQRKTEDLEKITIGAARFLFEHKAEDILVLRVQELLQICSYFILASGRSSRQVRTLGDGVERYLKPFHLPRIGAHGRDDSRWYCLDHGEIVLHIFDEEARMFYDLENLWSRAPRIEVDLQIPAVSSEAEEAS
ncbi:MAG: ribosome silencing factor [Planctomycetota bacterium]|nr:MAG: ribosome silencing factor [Planctomycetota bacterium]HIC23268.1 ribosome silencing factor [Planctomycetota bacterium]